ncbi:MAG TPA: winged helix-turn-helix domain-containing protein [Rhizomicrobium sp.]|jgi:TolB-like protein/DNA-binding winged helix-turn-helix (wHTH) protein/Tfp pilus assembly protein PilF|nr:winged helix-turn-helix domain-containing protein [Rhizomicrobium sp.]
MNYASRNVKAAPAISLAEEEDFSLGPLRVCPSARQVSVGERREIVEPRVMQVLVVLARAAGAVVSREHLVERCWGGRIVGDDAVNNAIVKVRALAGLSEKPAFEIETIPRVGYRLRAAAKATTETKAPETSSRFPRSPSTYAAIASGAFLLAALVFAGWEFTRSGAREPSIAVLPFRNLSSDTNAGYLAAGVQDEILTRLAKIGSLKVISRTSADQFANRSPNIQQIAKELGVANVLEGNVQKSGNNIRINVQLIRAATDEHLWAEDYDRKVGDLLTVESDVAGTIARVLAAKITPQERAEIAAKPTNNPRAYDLYLRALVFANKNEPTSLQTACQLLTEATRLDPKFALAWSKLVRNEAYRHFGDNLATVRKGAAHAALAKALALQPELPEAQAAKGFYLYYGEMNYLAAERQLRFVNSRWPNNTEAMEGLALVLRRLGKWKESADVFERLIRLDPLSKSDRLYLAIDYQFQNDSARSLAVIDRALQIWPDDGPLLSEKAGLLSNLGQLDAAGDVLKNVHPAPDDGDELGVFGQYFWFRRQYAKGAAFYRGLLALEQQGENRDSVTTRLRSTIGDFLQKQGDEVGARENFSAALASIQRELKADPGNTDLLNSLPGIYAGLGQNGKALALARENVRKARALKDEFALGGAEAAVSDLQMRFGNRSEVITQIARQRVSPELLRLDPSFDRLRGDPRFEALAHSDRR